MSNAPAYFLEQPALVKGLVAEQRDALIISMRKTSERTWSIVSRYGDQIWWLSGFTTNVRKSDTRLDFDRVAPEFLGIAKETTYRYMRRGREGGKRPKSSSITNHFKGVVEFCRYLSNLGISRLSDATTLVCSSYAQTLTQRIGAAKSSLRPSTVSKRLESIEALHELSLHTDDPMPSHPWPDSSASHISGYNKSRRSGDRTTPLIPHEQFAQLFQAAWTLVQNADHLLALRDVLAEIERAAYGLSRPTVNARKTKSLEGLGWNQGIKALQVEITRLRTACYIIIASLSGCRVHELAFLRTGCCYSTESADGDRYWWMRSRSSKTDEGHTEWMIPESAVTAIKIMERWSAPLHVELNEEIDRLRREGAAVDAIADAEEHMNALFVGQDGGRRFVVRTVATQHWNTVLEEFANQHGIKVRPRTHQFRRTFANYAARSQFGDLRYLKRHFKHWSMDMTLGYALNEDQEMALYLEIQDELDDLKEYVVADWLSPVARLAGGYGVNLANWRSREENIVMFKNHGAMVRSIAQSTAIRSNGHAWCTADSHDCAGNDIDPLRCGDGCSNAVVGAEHIAMYNSLYCDLERLRSCDDIGPGGTARVERDLKRCRGLLTQLGHDPLKVTQ
ncbi:tyrosine-type recombinase/integrase [Burkholderia contaminans]|uniref:Tyrosine-type recombinase/integrase n=1 Tax=Burkholderia contaminans TaxID=488447 RepID=A0AAP4RA93_9BURK|nr:tyrosine-type recombinase/integrase [Burkholderia contaminans]MDN7569966.1 tyrosine-type recombinase/integrase [Burkholderia contaminans]